MMKQPVALALALLTVTFTAAFGIACGSSADTSSPGNGDTSDGGGPVSLDGGGGLVTDAHVDAGGQLPDAGLGGDAARADADADAGGTCGGAICHAGQVCVAGGCSFTTCVGVRVPADAATVTAAIASLGSAGGTVCLAAQSFAESVNLTAAYGGNLVIQGVSEEQTSLTGLAVTSYGNPTCVLRGLHLGSLAMTTEDIDGMDSEVLTVSVTASKLDRMTLSGTSSSAHVDLYGVDASELKVNMGDDRAKFMLSIQNSYIHDSIDYGLQVTAKFETGKGGTATIMLANNTFATNGTGVAIDPSAATQFDILSTLGSR